MSYSSTAPVKDPQAVVRHGIDWSPWLREGETIISQSMTPQEGIEVDQVSQSEGVVSYRIFGGTAGADYLVTCQITTNLGNVDHRSIRYPVREL